MNEERRRKRRTGGKSKSTLVHHPRLMSITKDKNRRPRMPILLEIVSRSICTTYSRSSRCLRKTSDVGKGPPSVMTKSQCAQGSSRQRTSSANKRTTRARAQPMATPSPTCAAAEFS
ncbi:hypothetical protein PIIN_03734 [Serendipita indica DSM 11827]|uniref:Uncharacterized protein n=1 Tax=Serendipita indica (strain DSM 11827) TaxID=1109443 RepID=G4TEQ0_SERID|nr:hypothetical protein PIIN_03734 [Serendipita indica DSM 11827]